MSPAPSKKRSRTQETSPGDAHLAQQRFFLIWTTIGSLGKALIICACVALTAYIIFYLPVTVAPGQQTVVTTTQKFLANLHAHVVVAWGTAVGAGLMWAREKKYRMQERKEKDERIRELESQIDPAVTSSGLNLEGTGPQSEIP